MNSEDRARQVAHGFIKQCRGDEPTGKDRRRYHTKKCDELTTILCRELNVAYLDGAASSLNEHGESNGKS